MMKPMMTTAAELVVGDVILPPARELSLWMTRAAINRGLSYTATRLTVTHAHEGVPDKKGRWLLVTAEHTAEWNEGRTPIPFRFKARPETPWKLFKEEK